MSGVAPGRIVHYRLSEHEAGEIARSRETALAAAPPGHYVQMGNHPIVGDYYAAVIVKVWPGTQLVNLQVLLDGPDSYWATSKKEGAEIGEWCWPPRV